MYCVRKGESVLKVIVYGSAYGSTRRYAQELSARTGIPAAGYEEVKSLGEYQTILYIGALYAGSVLGMKKTLSSLGDLSGKKLLIVTCGVSDPKDAAYMDTVKAGIRKELGEEMYNHAAIFHLRGAIDYSRLSLKHRALMALLYRQALKMPEEKRTADIRAVIETYGKSSDFVDFDSLDPVIRELRQ